MGIGVVVQGYIECPGFVRNPLTTRVFHWNRRVIRSLPISDPEWPFITKDMFSMLPLRPRFERHVAQYDSQIIHFAGDYKNMFLLEVDWLRKFESLLARLCWDHAVANLEFSGLRYEWTASNSDAIDRYAEIPPRPPTEWTFDCFSVEKKPITFQEALDGPYFSPHHVRRPDAGK